MSFYRTYRPQTIGEIDNAVVAQRLRDLLTKDKKDLPHAYFLSGPRGAGKTTAARVIAKIYNCLTPDKKTHEPCGECEQCASIANGSNVDILELDAASNRGIDEIRQLKEGVHLAPSAASYKVYIIDEVHMLTAEAFNALLKTLEEPPVHAVFVLATTDPQKVPVTIQSRTMAIPFARAGDDEIKTALLRIVKQEKMKITDDAVSLIGQAADGSFRDAVKFLEQMSLHKGDITLETVNALLSLATDQSVAEFVNALYAKDSKGALSVIQKLTQAGSDIKAFVTSVLKYLHLELIAIITEKEPRLPDAKKIQQMTQVLLKAYGDLRITPVPSLPIEVAIVDYCGDWDKKNNIAEPAPRRNAPPPAKASTAVKDTAEEMAVKTQSIGQMGESEKTDGAEHEGNGLITLEKLTECWPDIIAEVKLYNHSVSGVLRSSRPKSVAHDIVTLEAFYPFHQEKLSELKTREVLTTVFKKLFGEKVKIEVVLGKK